MARVIVIGAGLAGLAAAVRLAKLGHQVVVCERSERLGGAIGRIEADGFGWDAGPASTTLPAALRDLFRKSGRPLEHLAQLDPITEPRRHYFTDGSMLDLPVGDRAKQSKAWADLAGDSTARHWTELVDSYGETWQLLRKNWLEPPLPDRIPRRAQLALKPWQTLDRISRRRLDDARARAVLNYYATREGSEPRRTPGFVGVWSYVERTFGRWSFQGGFGVLADALAQRATERKVEVRTGTEVAGVATEAGRVTGVRLSDGTALPAEIVVSDIDPRELYGHLVDDPAAGRERRRMLSTHPARSAYVVHLAMRDPLPELPFETVLHGSPTVLVRTGGQAPPGHQAWSVLVHGSPTDDVLDLLVDRGLPVRDKIVARHISPAWSAGVAWEGARTAGRRASNLSPVKGLYCVGAGAHPGAGVPAAALGAAIVAEAIGKA
ncbi:MAG TPA: FAD-dependent oxidoreductase [Kribbella sp.]|nr:FAD-dependent oxidoreductase [Kribbella sp.]